MRGLLISLALALLALGCARDKPSEEIVTGPKYEWTYVVCGGGMESNDCSPTAQFIDERSCLAHLRLSSLYCNFAEAKDGVVICRESSPAMPPASLRSTARCAPTATLT